jgi:hypothetical protein
MQLFNYIGGIAGTGKSYQLKQLNDKYPDSSVLTATTGVAAINMGCGITINSLLWYYNHNSLLDAWTSGKLDFRLNKVYHALGIRRILLDEVSMLSADDLSILCLAIDRLNENLAKNNKPQLGMTICGDFAQLPPIEGRFAFESEHWEKFEHTTEILHDVYRQNDPEFIQALQWVREGEGKKAADYFADKMNKLGDPAFDGTTLYPYNSSVDRQNSYRLEKVQGGTISFKAYKNRKQRPEWKNIPETLKLKLGSLVMILANRSHEGELIYCNGDLGHIIIKDRDTATVKLQRTGEEVEVKYVTRRNEEISGGEKKILGDINYMPLRLAYASTVHKSQGLTLDSVQIDIRPKFYHECPGMLYVAMSRCRSKEGLRLIGSPKTFAQNCTVNPKIRRFL